jgi:hypothetical protein
MNIFPSKIIKEEFNSSAEKKVYDLAMKSELFEEKQNRFLFYSVKNPSPDDNRLLGETDFIYLDKNIILFIEVKGGQVKYDSLSNQWWVLGGTKKGDPFAQAAKNLFNYREKKIPTLFGNQPIHHRLIFGYAVFFPDCSKPESFSKHSKSNVEYDPEIIVDFNDFETKKFEQIINGLITYWKNHKKYVNQNSLGISGRELFKIKNYIRKDIVFEIPWTDILMKYDTLYKRYTNEQQEHILSQLIDNPRIGVIVKGGPGTGKTWLAIEQAKRLDIQNRKVLFLCFNKNLALFLSKQLQILKTVNVEISYLHGFYKDILYQHFKIDINELLSKSDNNFWHKDLPLKIRELFFNYQGLKYDYVILDEAQDYFNEYHIDALTCLISRGFDSGNFLICLDSENQDFYLKADPEFEQYFRGVYPTYVSRLVKNCRNPQKVSDLAYNLTGITKQDCYFKEDVTSSKVVYYNDPDELVNKIKSFINQKLKENITIGSITVLAYNNQIKSLLMEECSNYVVDISSKNLFIKDKIMISTAHSFKGMENQFILFVGPTNFQINDDIQNKVIFNAFTRAKHQFIFFINKQYSDSIDNKLITNLIS